MTTLTVHPISEEQETTIRVFLDALHVDYRASDTIDDTEYLLSSPKNAAHLNKSIEQAKNCEVVKLDLDGICKLQVFNKLNKTNCIKKKANLLIELQIGLEFNKLLFFLFKGT